MASTAAPNVNNVTCHSCYKKNHLENLFSHFPCLEKVFKLAAKFFGLEGKFSDYFNRHHAAEVVRIIRELTKNAPAPQVATAAKVESVAKEVVPTPPPVENEKPKEEPQVEEVTDRTLPDQIVPNLDSQDTEVILLRNSPELLPPEPESIQDEEEEYEQVYKAFTFENRMYLFLDQLPECQEVHDTNTPIDGLMKGNAKQFISNLATKESDEFYISTIVNSALDNQPISYNYYYKVNRSQIDGLEKHKTFKYDDKSCYTLNGSLNQDNTRFSYKVQFVGYAPN